MGSANPGRHGVTAVAASAAVVAVTAGFAAYAASFGLHGESGDSRRYEASFLSSNGLQVGADVTVAGVPVGRVTAIALDGPAMTSRVSFVVRGGLELPADTRLAIGAGTPTSADSLMLAPGAAGPALAPGAVLTDTCPPVSLEQAVSRYIFGNGGAPAPCGD